MLQVRKLSMKKQALTNEIIQNACLYEREKILQIVPNKEFLDYALINNYQVLCSYRQYSLFKYKINSIDDLGNIDHWIPSIYMCLRNILRTVKDLTREEQAWLLEKQ